MSFKPLVVYPIKYDYPVGADLFIVTELVVFPEDPDPLEPEIPLAPPAAYSNLYHPSAHSIAIPKWISSINKCT
jgi:hypothetical protein